MEHQCAYEVVCEYRCIYECMHELCICLCKAVSMCHRQISNGGTGNWNCGDHEGKKWNRDHLVKQSEFAYEIWCVYICMNGCTFAHSLCVWVRAWIIEFVGVYFSVAWIFLYFL